MKTKASLYTRLKRRFLGEIEPHPVEIRMARQWIKRRLVAVFPELRNNPRELETAYRELDLDPVIDPRTGESSYVLRSPVNL